MRTHFICKISGRTHPCLSHFADKEAECPPSTSRCSRQRPRRARWGSEASARGAVQAPGGPARAHPTGRATSPRFQEAQEGRGPSRTPGLRDLQRLTLKVSGDQFPQLKTGVEKLPASVRPARPPRVRSAPHRPRAALPSGLLWAERGSSRGASSAPPVPGGKARPGKAGGGCSKSEPPLRGRPLKGRPSAAMAGETTRLRPRPRPPTSPGQAAAATATAEAPTSEPAPDLTSRLLEPSTPGRPGARRDLLCVEPRPQGLPGVAVRTDYEPDGCRGLVQSTEA